MANIIFYAYTDDDCRVETMSKEQILAAIEQAIEQGYVSDPDGAVFSKIKELRADATMQLWVGTEAQFNALNPAPTINKSVVRLGADGVLYLCTDDKSIPDVVPIGGGGTSAKTVEGARSNLGIPNPKTGDSGKFLRVNASGEYALETVPAAEGASF